jgi:hypothetical protein
MLQQHSFTASQNSIEKDFMIENTIKIIKNHGIVFKLTVVEPL